MAGYRQIQCIDRDGFGMEAFRMVIPEDWICYGGITWVNDIHMPACINFAVASPDGRMALEGFPILKFTWSNDPMIFRSQQSWQTQSTKAVAPLEPDEALLRYIITPFRQKMQSYNIIFRGPILPDDSAFAAAPAPQAPGVQMKFGKVRISYTVANNPIEEEFYTSVEYTRIPMGDSIFWQMNTDSVRAPQGELDRNLPLFRKMQESIQLNMEWVQQLTGFINGLYQQQIANIQQIGAFSRQYSQMQDRIMEQRMQSWENSNRQFEADRAAYNAQLNKESPSEKFSREAILGFEQKWDPYEEREIDVEGGHVDVWTNALGDRILSDSYNYNPNEKLTGNWKRMEQV